MGAPPPQLDGRLARLEGRLQTMERANQVRGGGAAPAATAADGRRRTQALLEESIRVQSDLRSAEARRAEEAQGGQQERQALQRALQQSLAENAAQREQLQRLEAAIGGDSQHAAEMARRNERLEGEVSGARMAQDEQRVELVRRMEQLQHEQTEQQRRAAEAAQKQERVLGLMAEELRALRTQGEAAKREAAAAAAAEAARAAERERELRAASEAVGKVRADLARLAHDSAARMGQVEATAQGANQAAGAAAQQAAGAERRCAEQEVEASRRLGSVEQRSTELSGKMATVLERVSDQLSALGATQERDREHAAASLSKARDEAAQASEQAGANARRQLVAFSAEVQTALQGEAARREGLADELRRDIEARSQDLAVAPPSPPPGPQSLAHHAPPAGSHLDPAPDTARGLYAAAGGPAVVAGAALGRGAAAGPRVQHAARADCQGGRGGDPVTATE